MKMRLHLLITITVALLNCTLISAQTIVPCQSGGFSGCCNSTRLCYAEMCYCDAVCVDIGDCCPDIRDCCPEVIHCTGVTIQPTTTQLQPTTTQLGPTTTQLGPTTTQLGPTTTMLPSTLAPSPPPPTPRTPSPTLRFTTEVSEKSLATGAIVGTVVPVSVMIVLAVVIIMVMVRRRRHSTLGLKVSDDNAVQLNQVNPSPLYEQVHVYDVVANLQSLAGGEDYKLTPCTAYATTVFATQSSGEGMAGVGEGRENVYENLNPTGGNHGGLRENNVSGRDQVEEGLYEMI